MRPCLICGVETDCRHRIQVKNLDAPSWKDFADLQTIDNEIIATLRNENSKLKHQVTMLCRVAEIASRVRKWPVHGEILRELEAALDMLECYEIREEDLNTSWGT